MSESKTKFVDGLWYRETSYGKHKINITIYRTPHSWSAKASCRGVGSVESGSSTALGATKSALKNLRLNIPLWSSPNYGLV
jgi:hypothetical protein